jgi:hypothetical protein
VPVVNPARLATRQTRLAPHGHAGGSLDQTGKEWGPDFGGCLQRCL